MDFIENLIMKKSRFFAMTVMIFLLFGITILFAGLAIKFSSVFLESKVPMIKYDRSNFEETVESYTERNQVDDNEKRLEAVYSKLVQESWERIMPVYEKLSIKVATEDYGTNVAKKNKMMELINDFDTRIKNKWLNDIKKYEKEYGEGFGVSYAKGYVNYILDAERESNISSDYDLFQKVMGRYENDYESRAKILINNRDLKFKWSDLIKNTVLIIALATLIFLIIIFLLFGVMFSIMRIEKKMRV